MGKRTAVTATLQHGPVLGAFNAATGTMATTMVADLAGVHPAWAMAAGGVGALISGGMALAQEMPRCAAYRLGCWVGAGGWSTWALMDTPWSASNLTALAIGGMAGGLIASMRQRSEQRAERERLRFAMALPRYRLAAEWEERITRVTNIKGVRVVEVETWDNGGGFTLDVQMPEGGRSWEDLAQAKKQLAADAALPNGCGVDVMPGVNRRAALMGVSTVDVLQQTRDLPADYSPKSICDPQEIGWYRDGSIAAADMREESWLIVGRKGSGKTTQLHRLISGAVRCTDALVWVIDLNQGALGRPWAEPWWEGQLTEGGAPAVDWIAHDAMSALAMTEAALAIAKDRKAQAWKLKKKHNVTLMPVSPDLPEIVIFVDEAAEILKEKTKHRAVAENLGEIQRIARDAGVNVVISSLRGTLDMIDSGIKSQCSVRIAMRMSDGNEIGNALGWHTGLTPQDMPYKGSGAVAVDDGEGESARTFKGANMLPSQIEECAVAVAGFRPPLDGRGKQVANAITVGKKTGVYERRWDHAPVIFGDVEADPADENEYAYAATGDTRGMEKPSMTPQEAIAQAQAAGRELRRLHALETGQDPELAEEFRNVVAGVVDPSNPHTWPDARMPAPRNYPVPELLERIVELIAGDAREFIASADIADALGMDTQALGIKLSKKPFMLNSQRDRRPEYGGEPTRGYFVADIHRLAEDFRTGKRSL